MKLTDANTVSSGLVKSVMLPMKLKGQASMIDVLLLGLFISIVLIGGTFFVGGEQLRAQQGRSDSIYAQTQLITLLNYRNASWNNATAAAMIDDAVCNLLINETPECSYDYNNENFYWTLQNTLNLTKRADYNYIFYVITNVVGQQNNFTICNKQLSVCPKNIQPARTQHSANCSGTIVTVDYALGIWPAWQELPEKC